MMSRGLLHGDASFDHTAWYLVARDLCYEGFLRGRHMEILEEAGRIDEYDWDDASCDAERFAERLSSLGWCLRDAGYMAWAERRAPGASTVSAEEARLIVWLHDNAHMPRVTTAISFGTMRPLIERLRRSGRR